MHTYFIMSRSLFSQQVHFFPLSIHRKPDSFISTQPRIFNFCVTLHIIRVPRHYLFNIKFISKFACHLIDVDFFSVCLLSEVTRA